MPEVQTERAFLFGKLRNLKNGLRPSTRLRWNMNALVEITLGKNCQMQPNDCFHSAKRPFMSTVPSHPAVVINKYSQTEKLMKYSLVALLLHRVSSAAQ